MQDGRAPRVKNRAPAAIQITAEQLLREAQERQETSFRAPRQRVEDLEELTEYRGRKRREFEERIRRTRGSIKEWLQYANWEASQHEFARSRSVFERALDVDPASIQIWLSYTEMELKNRSIQHARNLLDRAVTLLPRVDQLWYKYVYLEELLGNVPCARQVFERWLQWEPDDKAWQAYIKLEERYEESDRASAIYKRWIAVRPEVKTWIKWAKFEEERGRIDKAREVFSTALEFYGDDPEDIEKAQAVFGAFAKMETRMKEYERARTIYKFAIERIPRSKCAGLYATYTRFEKQHGSSSDAELAVIAKRRIQYEEELKHDGRNYEAWFDYVRMEEGLWSSLHEGGSSGDEREKQGRRIEEIYERAIAQVPPGNEKRYWRRYIFLWLQYALFEEVERKDRPRARDIYKTALKLVPHKAFTFAKLWVMFAMFEVRNLELNAARKILGTSIGLCPKPALFKRYIGLEIDLREFDRARMLYEKYLEFDPSDSTVWVKYAELETQLGDEERARAIYELGVSQELHLPEILWKAYIDFETGRGDREAARMLYERLIELSGHVKVWVSYALFEVQDIAVVNESEDDDDDDDDAGQEVIPGDPALSRKVFRRAYDSLKSKGLKAERAALLEIWEQFEITHGSAEDAQKVKGMKPVKGYRRVVDQETGEVTHDEDLIFPDEDREKNPSSFKFLQMARAWKESQSAKEKL